jgi:hypothetical protein
MISNETVFNHRVVDLFFCEYRVVDLIENYKFSSDYFSTRVFSNN